MIIVDKDGKYMEVEFDFTDAKETTEGYNVPYTIIKDYTSEQDTI